jgi:hypothetical protein
MTPCSLTETDQNLGAACCCQLHGWRTSKWKWSSRFLRNVDPFLAGYMWSHPGTHYSSHLLFDSYCKGRDG